MRPSIHELKLLTEIFDLKPFGLDSFGRFVQDPANRLVAGSSLGVAEDDESEVSRLPPSVKSEVGASSGDM